MEQMDSPKPKQDARTTLLTAALRVIRTQGYAGTSVDALCQAAGVTKGAFFHHFASKEALAVAAAKHWSELTGRVFATAPYHEHPDPLDRVHGYIDFRRAILKGDVPDFTCLVGTMVQETYSTAPAIRDASAASITGHAATLVPDITAAMAQHGLRGEWTAESLALHMQAVLQGAFILAKATGDVAVAASSIDHLRRYVELLFRPTQPKEETSCLPIP
jgi:TetR/AcrR family transcriptional regulator, transcriptional repressor for nem operon